MVGGGPSGLSAALAARRTGADVIIMERLEQEQEQEQEQPTLGLVVSVVVSPLWAWRPLPGTDTRGRQTVRASASRWRGEEREGVNYGDVIFAELQI